MSVIFIVFVMFVIIFVEACRPRGVAEAGERRRVVVLATGGTIAGSGETGKSMEYKSGTLSAKELVSGVSGIEELADVEVENISNIDSSEMSWDIWLKLAERINELAESDGADGFVITHGTDTLEETAFFLWLTARTKKPVVITGSMRPATALSPDGPMNLYQAVALAASDAAIGRGTLVVFADGIYCARDVQKVSTFMPAAFSGRDFGCVGYMRDDKPLFFYASEGRSELFRIRAGAAMPKVAIAYFHADADAELLEDMLQSYDGVVIAGVGNGGVSEKWKSVIRDENAKNIPVVISSRVGNGFVDQWADWPEVCISAGTLNAQKSRVLLMLALTDTSDAKHIRDIFKKY